MEPVVEQKIDEAAAPPVRRRSRGLVRRRAFGATIDPYLAFGLSILIPGTALAIGTVHVLVLLIVGALAIVLGVLAVRARTPLRVRSPMRLAVWITIVLIAWTAIQAMPMPLSWVRVIAPANGDIWYHALDALGQPPPKWASLSLDPGASWIEALKGVSYLSVMLAGCAVASKRGASFGVGTVFVTALLCSATTVAHGLLGLDKVFGVYEPHYRFSTWHIGPFLNPNHLAAYLNLGTMCGLALVLMRKPVVPPWLASLGVMLLIGSTVTSASRGAVVLLPLGLAALAVLTAYHARRHDARAYMRPARLLAMGAVGIGGGLAALGLTTGQLQELLDKDLGKLSMFSWGRPLIAEHRWVGIGRGAFETVFPAFNKVPGHTTFTHPENLIVQWVAEWGIVVGLGAGLAMAWAMRPQSVGARRSLLMAGAWTGIVLLLLQNLVDFNLELPSVGMAVALLIGSFWGDASRTGHGIEPDETSRRTWLVPLAAGAATTIWLLALTQGLKTPFADREALFALSKQPPLGRDAYHPMLRAAILRHPAEPYFPLVAAERAWRMRDEDPVPYLQRTLERAATYGRAHLLLAEILAAQGAVGQAMMALRMAIGDDPALIGPAVRFALRWTNDRDFLWKVLPETPARGTTASALGAALSSANSGLSRVFDEESLRVDSTQVGPRIRLANHTIEHLRSEKPEGECSGPQREKCIARVDDYARQLANLQPGSSQGAQMRARLLMGIGRPRDAADTLRTACENAIDRLQCCQLRLEIAKELQDRPAMEQLLKLIAVWGCTDSQSCANTWFWIGSFNEGTGNLGAAVTAYEKAAERNPGDAATWMRLGEATSRIGAHARAVHAFERAAARSPNDTQLSERLRQARLRVLGEPGTP